jgi:hypothetical protein
MKVIRNPYLARQTRVIIKVGFRRENCAFRFADLARIASKNLDAAGCAPRVAAASMQNVDAAVFDCQHQFFAFFGLKGDSSIRRFGGDLLHR